MDRYKIRNFIRAETKVTRRVLMRLYCPAPSPRTAICLLLLEINGASINGSIYYARLVVPHLPLRPVKDTNRANTAGGRHLGVVDR